MRRLSDPKVGFAQKIAHGLFDVLEGFLYDRLSSYKDKVVSTFHARDHRAERFPQPAFDAVAYNTVAQFFADGKSDAYTGHAGPGVNEHHQPAAGGFPRAVNIAELFVPFQGVTAFHIDSPVKERGIR